MDPLPPDPYKALGLTPSDSQQAIKTAYRKAALKYHPDKDPAGKFTELFHRIQAAYELIGEADERQKYDDLAKLYSLRSTLRSSPQDFGTVPIYTTERRPPARRPTAERRPSAFDEDFFTRSKEKEKEKEPSRRRSERVAERTEFAQVFERKEKKEKSAKERADSKKQRDKERERDRFVKDEFRYEDVERPRKASATKTYVPADFDRPEPVRRASQVPSTTFPAADGPRLRRGTTEYPTEERRPPQVRRSETMPSPRSDPVSPAKPSMPRTASALRNEFDPRFTDPFATESLPVREARRDRDRDRDSHRGPAEDVKRRAAPAARSASYKEPDDRDRREKERRRSEDKDAHRDRDHRDRPTVARSSSYRDEPRDRETVRESVRESVHRESSYRHADRDPLHINTRVRESTRDRDRESPRERERDRDRDHRDYRADSAPIFNELRRSPDSLTDDDYYSRRDRDRDSHRRRHHDSGYESYTTAAYAYASTTHLSPGGSRRGSDDPLNFAKQYINERRYEDTGSGRPSPRRQAAY